MALLTRVANSGKWGFISNLRGNQQLLFLRLFLLESSPSTLNWEQLGDVGLKDMKVKEIIFQARDESILKSVLKNDITKS